MRHQVIGDKLAEHFGAPVLQGKGGFWVKGRGFIGLQEARKITDTPAPPRQFRERIGPYGDWAIVAKLNGVRRKAHKS